MLFEISIIIVKFSMIDRKNMNDLKTKCHKETHCTKYDNQNRNWGIKTTTTKVNSVFSAFKDHYVYNVFDEKHYKFPFQKYQW